MIIRFYRNLILYVAMREAFLLYNSGRVRLRFPVYMQLETGLA